MTGSLSPTQVTYFLLWNIHSSGCFSPCPDFCLLSTRSPSVSQQLAPSFSSPLLVSLSCGLCLPGLWFSSLKAQSTYALSVALTYGSDSGVTLQLVEFSCHQPPHLVFLPWPLGQPRLKLLVFRPSDQFSPSMSLVFSKWSAVFLLPLDICVIFTSWNHHHVTVLSRPVCSSWSPMHWSVTTSLWEMTPIFKLWTPFIPIYF